MNNKPAKKTYIQGIILGVLSILSGLLFVGIPFGTAAIEIANMAVLGIGMIVVLIVGILLKKYTAALITSVIYLVVTFALTMFIEINMSDFILVGVGFVPGLSIAITGLITAVQQKGQKKILAGIIINAIGILIGVASLVMTLMNSFVGG